MDTNAEKLTRFRKRELFLLNGFALFLCVISFFLFLIAGKTSVLKKETANGKIMEIHKSANKEQLKLLFDSNEKIKALAKEGFTLGAGLCLALGIVCIGNLYIAARIGAPSGADDAKGKDK